MATTYGNNQFRSGLKVLLDGDPCVMIEVEFVKPGKGQAFTRVKYRNLKTGRVLEKTFKSSEGAEAADVVDPASAPLRVPHSSHILHQIIVERAQQGRRPPPHPKGAPSPRTACRRHGNERAVPV